MKIGIQANSIENKGYGRWGENAYKKMREHGFSCSDFSMMNPDSVLYTGDEAYVRDLLIREKHLSEAAGITISQVHGPWRSVKENTAAQMEMMKRSIYLTSVLGCKNWVVHPLMPLGVKDLNADDTKKTWEINRKFFSELLITAKENGVTICLENMPFNDFSMSTPKSILKFVNEINDESFKICLDTGHVSIFKELDLAEETRRLGNKIKALHVHDNKHNRDLHLMPCFGIINWAEFRNALENIGFNGSFSLETIPPHGLTDELFEDACKLLFKLSANIINI